MTKKYFSVPIAIVADHYKDLATLHNELAKKVWVGAIKVPLHIFVSRNYPHDGVFTTKVSLRTDYYANFSAGTLNIVNGFFGSDREAARFARYLKKRFNIASIEI